MTERRARLAEENMYFEKVSMRFQTLYAGVVVNAFGLSLLVEA